MSRRNEKTLLKYAHIFIVLLILYTCSTYFILAAPTSMSAANQIFKAAECMGSLDINFLLDQEEYAKCS